MTRPLSPRAAVAVVALALLAGGAPADAQVYKCTDAAGRTTYQQSPCTGGQKGGALNLATDNGSSRGPDTPQAWNDAVAEKRVVAGMPMQWVIQSLGSPSERRAARPGESATQVWLYPQQGEVLRVGFVGDAVAWTARDPVVDPATLRNPALRAAVAAGRACDEVLKELGTPSAEEPAGEIDTATGRPKGAVGRRYTFEPEPGDNGPRLAFTCFENRVIDVERSQVR